MSKAGAAKYEKMTNDELNQAIHTRIGARGFHFTANGQEFRAYPNYLRDDGATWRAFAELAHKYEMIWTAMSGGVWFVDCGDQVEVQGMGGADVRRAVWIAWLTMYDLKVAGSNMKDRERGTSPEGADQDTHAMPAQPCRASEQQGH